MKNKALKSCIALIVLLVLVFVCTGLAAWVLTDFGKVEVTLGSLETDKGTLTYRLYTPRTATAQTPAPGMLLLHGYQNDKDTSSAYALELARRGMVVLALDEYGHGNTQVGMAARGFVNHKATVNYGEANEEDGTFVSMGGPRRVKILSNFSDLSFFNEKYSADTDGNSIVDSAMGGIEAYALLTGLPNVVDTRCAVGGHSMGTWASWSVAAAYSGSVNAAGGDIAPKAVVLQCGELFGDEAYDSASIHFNNVLILQAKYDEFNMFRDYKPTVTEAMIHSPLRAGFLGAAPADAAWDTTFGSFAEGTARRIQLLQTNHRLVTHSGKAIATATDWLAQAIDLTPAFTSTTQVYMVKEWLLLAAMLCALLAMLPLLQLLLLLPFFSPAAQPLPPLPGAYTRRAWWKGAIITMLIAGFSYPFMTQLGQGLLPVPEGVFRMPIATGFWTWYVLLILVMAFTFLQARHKARKKGEPQDLYDLGLATAKSKHKVSWGFLGRGLLLALCMVGMVYLLVTLCQAFFGLDLRFIWPFFRTYSGERLVQLCVYLPVFALFFLLNNSKLVAGMRTRSAAQPGFKHFMASWGANILLMIGGVLLIVLIEYIPFFAGIGPGADLLFSTTFGGPFMSLLIVFIPQVTVLALLCTAAYRKTGQVYTGAFTAALLACWIVTGGSAIL
ncbi:MAG: alpha/beta hydrolase [Christensenellaceae bacterium]|nr:alpha/beta hydrolase [Christensenellaceae bacterium]